VALIEKVQREMSESRIGRNYRLPDLKERALSKKIVDETTGTAYDSFPR
jgi:hypothetical protein